MLNNQLVLEINNVKKLLSKKENLNKLKKNQVIQFTLDLENSNFELK